MTKPQITNSVQTGNTRKRKNIEQSHQIALVTWFGMSYPKLKDFIISIPNEGKRSLMGNIMLKRAGMKKGIPDLFIAIPNKDKHGFFIELKQPGKKPRPEQADFLEKLRGQGYRAEWYDDWREAAYAVESYMKASY